MNTTKHVKNLKIGDKVYLDNTYLTNGLIYHLRNKNKGKNIFTIVKGKTIKRTIGTFDGKYLAPGWGLNIFKDDIIKIFKDNQLELDFDV